MSTFVRDTAVFQVIVKKGMGIDNYITFQHAHRTNLYVIHMTCSEILLKDYIYLVANNRNLNIS